MAPHFTILLLFSLLTTVFSSTTTDVNVKFELPDNLRANQNLGKISAKSNVIPTPAPGSAGFFRVMKEPNTFIDRFFTVNDRSSELSTHRAIDRDAVCGRLNCCEKLVCETNFTVFIRQTSRVMFRVQVTVVFQDENDNRPHIPPENITLPESAAIGYDRALLTAKDADSKPNSVVRYSIIDPTGTFGLHMLSPTRPMLSVLKKLDADDPERREFLLTYTAADGGSPSLTGSTTLYVHILDENDNSPIFRDFSRTTNIPENTTVGSEIYRFEASDGDVDAENKRITFHLDTAKSTPEGIAANKFSVNAATGAVTVRQPLDFDSATERIFTLVVEARDHGSPALSSTASVTVMVRNVNDNPPSIAVTSSQPLTEAEKAGQRVRTISVSDLDQLESIKVSCSLVSSPGFKIVPITEQHYFDIVTTRVFDFEATPVVNVTIACRDEQPPRRTVRKTLTIPVVDINDHNPIFELPSYTTQLAENVPLGSEVLTVSATDQDSGLLGTVRYALDAEGRKWFKIETLNGKGIIYVNTTLDREAQARLNFYVTAFDLGRPPRTASAPVRVTVTDVNDNPPVLVGPKAVDVVENARPGTVVTRVSFRDPDEGVNGQVDFKLVRDKNKALRFLNMTSDGRVIVIRPINREEHGRLYLEVQARDRGTPVMETTVTLIVRVLDLNDNAPRLMEPANYSVLGHTVFANSPYNTTVGDLRATDKDLHENGSVVFDILDTNATGMFRLEPDTGRLYSAWKYPSQPGHGLYQLRIRLTDRGQPPLSSQAILFVNVGAARNGKVAGISNIIILVLIIIASLAIATALVMAILWARSRAKRSAAGHRSPDYAEYDPAVKKPRSMGDTETLSNVDMVSGLAVDPMADSASTIARSQKTPSRMSQYADYVIPYPMPTTGSKRDSRSPHSFESSYPGQIRTFGHQSPIGQSFAMENFATVGRPGATSPASYQHRSGAFANPHLLPEMFEDDPRQSELSYDDSGKGGSVDDVGRLVLAQHAPSVAASALYPMHHLHHHRASLRAHPGGPGHLAVGAEATLC